MIITLSKLLIITLIKDLVMLKIVDSHLNCKLYFCYYNDQSLIKWFMSRKQKEEMIICMEILAMCAWFTYYFYGIASLNFFYTLPWLRFVQILVYKFQIHSFIHMFFHSFIHQTGSLWHSMYFSCLWLECFLSYRYYQAYETLWYSNCGFHRCIRY